MDFIAMMIDPDLDKRAYFWELWRTLTPAEREVYDRIALRESAGTETDADRVRAEELYTIAKERHAE